MGNKNTKKLDNNTNEPVQTNTSKDNINGQNLIDTDLNENDRQREKFNSLQLFNPINVLRGKSDYIRHSKLIRVYICSSDSGKSLNKPKTCSLFY